MDAFRAVRDSIPAAGRGLYFDCAATSPLPRPVIDAVVASMERRAAQGEGFYDDAVARADAVRGVIARYLGVSERGIAFTKNTGEGLNHVARSLAFPKGSNVVITGLEFPTNWLPWHALSRRGVALRVVPPDDGGMGVTPEALAQHVDGRTALVAVSSVTFNTGYRHDIEAFARIAHEHGALLLVDSIQGLGAVSPAGLARADFIANGGHKWLMAPLGVGFLYVRPDLVAALEPDHVGWGSLADTMAFDNPDPVFAADARRFEVGNLAFDLIEGLGAAFRLFPDPAAVERRILHLSGRLLEGLGPLGRVHTPADPARRAGIVRFLPDDPAGVHARLQQAGVQCSLRSGGVRFSPHVWITDDEVDRVVDHARAAARRT